MSPSCGMRCPRSWAAFWSSEVALSIAAWCLGTSLGSAFPIVVVDEACCSLCDVALGQQWRVWGCLGQSHQKMMGRRRNESLLGLAPCQIFLAFYGYKGRGAEVSSRGWGSWMLYGASDGTENVGDTGHGFPSHGDISSSLCHQPVPLSPKLDPCAGFRAVGVRSC